MEPLIALGVLIVGLLIVLRIILGQNLFSEILSKWIIKAILFVLTLPFKILSFIPSRINRSQKGL